MKKTIAIIINVFIAVPFIVLPAVKAQETQAKIT